MNKPLIKPLTKLKILIADDHDIVRRGLRSLVEDQDGWEVCAEAGTGRQAVEKALLLKPDVAVLDITMPELNGLEATRQIRRAQPSTEVLVLTVHETEELVREVLKAGARGYILKSDAGRDLIAAIQSIAQKKPYFNTKVAKLVSESFLKSGTIVDDEDVVDSPLTPREREIVQLLAEGKANKEVGDILGISVKTAETHRTNIMRKLHFHSIGELVRYAIRNKIVSA
ncbi:DNA-binding response regulator [Verrucomicrobiota bacterium]|nr:DNA-binding response regulator [Verrucomicrobiota bacterium]